MTIEIEILEILPPCWDIEVVMKKHPISYTDSLASVLYQEVVAYNKLITVIRHTISNVQISLKGSW